MAPVISSPARLRELSPDAFSPESKEASLLRFEISDSGNIHLYATIDEQERRRVITKKSAEYEAVLDAMKKRLSENQQLEIIERFFRR